MANLHNQKYIIKLKQGLVANINTTATKNSAVEGEPHYTTDGKKLYIFDGTVNLPVTSRKTVTITAINYTALVTDEVIVVTATATVTLPATSGSGQTYRIVCRAGTTTIQGTGADTIKGSATQTLYPGEDIIITDSFTGGYE